jgi:NTP pyrophosphatase (non-canonical NTP hydrolase)
MTINQLQKQILQNKKAKGFHVTPEPEKVREVFCALYGEVAEAYEAWRRKKSDLPQEIADVVIFAIGLFDQLGFNACDEIKKKMEINSKRVYYKDEQGIWQKKLG